MAKTKKKTEKTSPKIKEKRANGNGGADPGTQSLMLDTSYEWHLYFSPTLGVTTDPQPTATGGKHIIVKAPSTEARVVAFNGTSRDSSGKDKKATFLLHIPENLKPLP